MINSVDNLISVERRITWDFFVNKYYFFNIWNFDLNQKLSFSIKSFYLMPKNLLISFTTPCDYMWEEGDLLGLFLLNGLKILTFFSFQQAFLFWAKNKIFGSKKKKSSQYILKSISSNSFIFFSLYFLVITVFPYLRVTKTDSTLKLLSGNNGIFSFMIKDINYFSDQLDESYIDWEEKIFISLNFWFSEWLFWRFWRFFFLKSMWNWLLWSSINVNCAWGHGGWDYEKIIWHESLFNNFWLKKHMVIFF